MIYFWYSGATDVTGQALADALNAEGVRERPNTSNGDIVVGWGTKINRDVNFNNNVHVLNHPNAIRKNRNKYEALKIMASYDRLENCVAKFTDSQTVLDKLRRNQINLPLIGRTKFHQGGKGLWVCLTKSHVKHALDDGADYFQEYIDIKNEYRIHVMFGDIVKVVKKEARPEKEYWIQQRKEKVENYANKNNVHLDNDTLEYTLKILAKEIKLPDMIVRSNKMGWVFNSVNRNISAALKTAAIAAVEAIGLDFGAVDCAIDVNSNPYIIEVNSGPGLKGDTLTKYVNRFREKFDLLLNRNVNVRRRAVGAAEIEEDDNNAVIEHIDDIDDNVLIRLIRNVNNDEEARAVLRLLARR